jgi:hypothetical protein
MPASITIDIHIVPENKEALIQYVNQAITEVTIALRTRASVFFGDVVRGEDVVMPSHVIDWSVVGQCMRFAMQQRTFFQIRTDLALAKHDYVPEIAKRVRDVYTMENDFSGVMSSEADKDLNEWSAFQLWYSSHKEWQGKDKETINLVKFRLLPSDTRRKWVSLATETSEYKYIASACNCDPKESPRASLNRLQDVMSCSGCRSQWHFNYRDETPKPRSGQATTLNVKMEINPHAPKEMTEATKRCLEHRLEQLTRDQMANVEALKNDREAGLHIFLLGESYCHKCRIHMHEAHTANCINR